MRWVIVFAFLLSGCSDGFQRAGPPTRSPVKVSAPVIISDDPVVLVNDFRRSHGLYSVVMDAKLTALAQEQSSAMASSGRLDHAAGAGTFMIRMSRAQIGSRVVENIGAGYPDFPRALNGWIISPQHKANLMMSGANRMGVASAQSADGKTTYWTLLLAAGGYE